MTKKMRDIGAEILESLQEIKRGEVGRVINVPDIAEIREKTGLSQKRFVELLGVSERTFKIGSKDIQHLPGPPGPDLWPRRGGGL